MDTMYNANNKNNNENKDVIHVVDVSKCTAKPYVYTGKKPAAAPVTPVANKVSAKKGFPKSTRRDVLVDNEDGLTYVNVYDGDKLAHTFPVSAAEYEEYVKTKDMDLFAKKPIFDRFKADCSIDKVASTEQLSEHHCHNRAALNMWMAGKDSVLHKEETRNSLFGAYPGGNRVHDSITGDALLTYEQKAKDNVEQVELYYKIKDSYKDISKGFRHAPKTMFKIYRESHRYGYFTPYGPFFGNTSNIFTTWFSAMAAGGTGVFLSPIEFFALAPFWIVSFPVRFLIRMIAPFRSNSMREWFPEKDMSQKYRSLPAIFTTILNVVLAVCYLWFPSVISVLQGVDPLHGFIHNTMTVPYLDFVSSLHISVDSGGYFWNFVFVCLTLPLVSFLWLLEINSVFGILIIGSVIYDVFINIGYKALYGKDALTNMIYYTEGPASTAGNRNVILSRSLFLGPDSFDVLMFGIFYDLILSLYMLFIPFYRIHLVRKYHKLPWDEV